MLKSTLTSTARAAGLARARAAERPASPTRASQGSHKASARAAERQASQARASQGSQKVTRKFSTFSTFSSNSILTVVVLAEEGEGTSTTQGVADAFRIPVEVCIAGKGAVIVPEFAEGDQNFLHFPHELLRFAI